MLVEPVVTVNKKVSSMNVEKFFQLLIGEMEDNQELKGYYKFLKNPSFFNIRKTYFCQRLRYLMNHLDDPVKEVCDCGCGHGTTPLFLAMNGIKVHGITIGEHYFNGIERRRDFWGKFGDTNLFTVSCESLFDAKVPPASYDAIIIQDTLHHLEPVQDALAILYRMLKPNGKLIILEANGGNLIHKLRLYMMRGNKKVIEIYDEYLQKNVLYGNENYRSIREWSRLLENQNFVIDSSVQYIKFFYPQMYNMLDQERFPCDHLP